MSNNNENFEICSSCNGKCCKYMPGIVSPFQYKEITEELLKSLLENGYQFDYWEGDINSESQGITAYYLRPQTKTSIGRKVDPSWGGECVFFTNNKGCSKKFEDRPIQCQTLLPNQISSCKPEKGAKIKKELIEEWLPYNNIILKVIE